jgi:hypothetical protein
MRQAITTICLSAAVLLPGAALGCDLDTLATWMTGSFSSERQAAATHLDQPYRQRVYHVTMREDGAFVSAVYSIPDAMEHAGAYRDTEPLAGLKPESLELRTGCAVILRKKGDQELFEGETVGKECISALRGASYATSEVQVAPDRILEEQPKLHMEGLVEVKFMAQLLHLPGRYGPT